MNVYPKIKPILLERNGWFEWGVWNVYCFLETEKSINFAQLRHFWRTQLGQFFTLKGAGCQHEYKFPFGKFPPNTILNPNVLISKIIIGIFPIVRWRNGKNISETRRIWFSLNKIESSIPWNKWNSMHSKL